MALQLKGGNQDNINKGDDSRDTSNALDKRNSDPWGNKDIEDNIYEENLVRMQEEVQVASAHFRRRMIRLIVGILSAAIIIGLIYFGRSYILERLNPTIIDLTPYATQSEKNLVDGLDVEMTESGDWLIYILSWLGTQNRQLEVHANEELGVFYLDGRKTGIFVHEKNYKLYNIQVGMGDKEALEATTYPWKENDYFVVEEDMDEGKNTTYYYFDKSKNDCIGITKNDTTNTVEGIIYIDNYQFFSNGLKQE